ncbi:unnamed protein product [Arctogadus glacialis]
MSVCMCACVRVCVCMLLGVTGVYVCVCYTVCVCHWRSVCVFVILCVCVCIRDVCHLLEFKVESQVFELESKSSLKSFARVQVKSQVSGHLGQTCTTYISKWTGPPGDLPISPISNLCYRAN